MENYTSEILHKLWAVLNDIRKHKMFTKFQKIVANKQINFYYNNLRQNSSKNENL